VLLARPVSQSGDERIATLAFEIIGRLRNEKDVLITKAVSWLLRSLIKNHQDEVREYIANNSEELPKIAVREVRNKLETGKKNRIVSRQTLS
jgi:3-methyladenine DNA glycosylase AlkD